MIPEQIAVTPRTVVESCFEGTGSADLSFVYDVGLAVGVAEQAVRLAVRRLADAGVLEQEGRGRRGVIRLLPAGLSRLHADTRIVEFAYAQDEGGVPWDGLWRLHTFSVPEQERATRDALRRTLVRYGAAQLTPGVYVTPHDLGGELGEELPADALAQLYTIVASAIDGPGCETPLSTAERLWPAAATIEAYAPISRFLDEAHPPARDTGRAAQMAYALRLIEGLGQGLEEDPLLPAELRASPWPPREIRARFLTAWNALARLAPDLPVFRSWRTQDD
ncbi:phenylacetic acid degradation operon negative regulatory protein [Microbacterium resistens]|uniref:Phenylacetic acid degradation operon negative regulatory protein n=1 Tax=Microbacterium resistens TaxID=156977 RepID=A0ABU1SDQ9_9MICO|nr:PaaX family transcriptional regulator [Microbacterium resistens]MDR6867729.1 phenylacetic acid degradation operon negative regulatory protein [Microbacterium resistens]